MQNDKRPFETTPDEHTTNATSNAALSEQAQDAKASQPAAQDGNNDIERIKSEAAMGYDQQIKILQDAARGKEPETDEERKKRERKERSKRIIASVGDGISALSNLFFTSRGAPDMYRHGSRGQLGVLNDKLEKQRAEREKNHEAYINYSMNIGKLQAERDNVLRGLEAQHEARKLAREEAKRKQEAHEFEQSLNPFKTQKAQGEADQATYKADTARTESEYASKQQEAKLMTEYARRQNHLASAGAHGRTNTPEFSAWDEHGREHKFRTKAASEAFAKQHGTWQEEDVSETTNTETRRTPESKPQQRTSTKSKKVGYPVKPQKSAKSSISIH